MARKKKKTIKKPSQKIIKLEPKLEGEGVKRTRIRVIGIGGGGGSIVSEIASRIKKASFVVANTDVQALRLTPRIVSRFQFGQSLTRGLGTGMNAELAAEAAQGEKDKIKKLLEGQDLCILIACLGGGAGSGAIPTFAKISRQLGNLTYGIFTLPFKFEGDKKMEIARESLKKVKTHLNAITLIPNERVFQIIDKSTPLRQALSTVNKNLADSLEGLIETIYEPGLINIDFADFKAILEGRGRLAYLNTVEIQRKGNSVKDLIDLVLTSPLYSYNIRGAKGILFNISGEKNLSLSEVGQISKTISDLANKEAKIIFGIAQKQKHSDVMKTTLLATGCGMKIFSSGPKKPKKKKAYSKRVKQAVKKIVKKRFKKNRLLRKKRASRKKSSKVIKRKKVQTKSKKKAEKKKTARRVPQRKKLKSRKKRVIKNKTKKLKPSNKKKKIKIKIIKDLKEKIFPQTEEKEKEVQEIKNIEERVRKNGLQIKRESEEVEKEILEKEKFWETPAFLRKEKKDVE